MIQLGIDIGASTVKMVALKDGEVSAVFETVHHEQPMKSLAEGLQELRAHLQEEFALGVTGCNAGGLLSGGKAILHKEMAFLEDIPAIAEGAKYMVPDAASVIEIGSQGSRFLTNLNGGLQFATNGHCAGGTGSFFEDQMMRLGLKLEDYSGLVEQAESVPRLSGRCAVFAKTDIIHRQQEGVCTPDILLGLCYAMIRNYKATIVRTLPVGKPLVFCGGVTRNTGAIRAIRDIFELEEEELVVPSHAPYAAAIGAALKADGTYQLDELMEVTQFVPSNQCETMKPLKLVEGTILENPACTGMIPEEGIALGIDIGSTSTDLVLIGRDGTLIDYQYLRTAGNPEAAVRTGLSEIKRRFGEISFAAVGVTGSGRERIGRMIGADAIRDEITAQATGAAHECPDVDTVFEIGGQDSKFIRLKDGEVVDFQMNKICAAGTGSFVEEQAARMGIPIKDFGPLALRAEAPIDLGERCTVFIETAITSACAKGVSQADIAAGLCDAIVRNYLHKVVGNKPVGERIVLQGGVAYNPGIVAAFQKYYGDRMCVNPCFPISGAYGVALLALDAVGDGKSTFAGFDFSRKEVLLDTANEKVRENIAFYEQANRLLLEGYTGKREPGKKTVGIPYVLMIHKFFPMANAFFQSLGFNVLLTEPTNEETIRLSQESARGETCYPVKLIYGHMRQLIEQKVDYIFLPAIHTMKHEKSKVEHNYGCVYMQTAAVAVARALNLEEHHITLLNPVFDLDFGKEAMASAMLGLGKILKIPKPLCAKALLAGAMAVRKHTAAVEKLGAELLESLKPEDKVLVLITRNYGVSDPVLNMGIPKLLLERGYKVITLSHLPAHDLDLSAEYPNLYWPFGQHILSGAKIIANHPNLYAVYLTNHGCGPDSMLSHLFRQEMGDKPYLQIEVDEHFSKVGVITRVEAFLNSLSNRETVTVSKEFDWRNVPQKKLLMRELPERDLPLFVPDFGWYTGYLAEYFKEQGVTVSKLPSVEERVVQLGRSYTNSKEYLPFAALLGEVMEQRKERSAPAQYLIPQTLGAEADGQYARVMDGILRRNGFEGSYLVAPVLERLPETVKDLDFLVRTIVTGDLLYAAPMKRRGELAPEKILSWTELFSLAQTIGELETPGKKIAVVGTPMCLAGLDNGVLDTLDAEENTIYRAPLAEYLCFLWKENEKVKGAVQKLLPQLKKVGELLGDRNGYSMDFDNLSVLAEQYLPQFSGGNGRYRYAKAVQMGQSADAVLAVSPRYENTAMVLDLFGIADHAGAPFYSVTLDYDWDESAWSKLRSFLYYC